MAPCQQTSYAKGIGEQELVSLTSPAQYLGGESNSVLKNDADVDLHFALAFPDTYEVGMSHIGIQLLYEIINKDPQAWAERAYMPLADMEELLREKKQRLRSLESKRELTAFDILGFSLQYELCATNILAMLDLGGIPLYANEREKEHPLIIGGGPYTYHPEALAPFFDAFFLGDAEEAVTEIMDAVRKHKSNPHSTRENLLEALHQVEGIYVPSFFEPQYDEAGALQSIQAKKEGKNNVVRRLLPTMEGAPRIQKPIIPNTKTVHNRLSVEVMRGCVRGCRFCQAGYLYRPQRERSPEEIVEILEGTLPETGFEEVSLLSLSTADYCSVVPLLKNLMDQYAEGDRLAISFPSTRVDALTPEVLEQVQRVRRTGFTVAPEGGTQRLRDVINKGVSDEQILETCSNVFRMGWKGIKLYFMLGLPTETDEDLQGIIDIAQRIKALPEAKGKDITVSVSTHVPKPHTPFQWAEQICVAETLRRQRYLSSRLRELRIKFRYHDAYSSFLEGVFCRGDRDLARVIHRAYELGCRLDAWTEQLKEDLWTQAFLDCDIDPNYYLRERDVQEALPWDHLSCGIPKSYFAKEYRRALRDKPTPDCLTQSCSVCGACDYDVSKNVLWPREETEEIFGQRNGTDAHSNGQSDTQEKREAVKAPETTAKSPNLPNARIDEPVLRLRTRFKKAGVFRYLGHLELVKVIQRAMRRANIPLAYSAGFHPMPRLAFGPPLQLGVASSSEHFDAFLIEKLATEDYVSSLNAVMPDGLSIESARPVSLRERSLSEQIIAHRYKVSFYGKPTGPLGEELSKQNGHPANTLSEEILELSIKRAVKAKKKKKKFKPRREAEPQKWREFKLADYLSETSLNSENPENPELEFTLKVDHSAASPKATEVVSALSSLNLGDYQLEKLCSYFQ